MLTMWLMYDIIIFKTIVFFNKILFFCYIYYGTWSQSLNSSYIHSNVWTTCGFDYFRQSLLSSAKYDGNYIIIALQSTIVVETGVCLNVLSISIRAVLKKGQPFDLMARFFHKNVIWSKMRLNAHFSCLILTQIDEQLLLKNLNKKFKRKLGNLII